jgi:hypothetical protein
MEGLVAVVVQSFPMRAGQDKEPLGKVLLAVPGEHPQEMPEGAVVLAA